MKWFVIDEDTVLAESTNGYDLKQWVDTLDKRVDVKIVCDPREFLEKLAKKIPEKHRSGLYTKKVKDWDSVWTFLMNESKELEGEDEW